MLSVVITSFQFGLCSRKILENETNIESFGCVLKNDEIVTIIPFYPCYLNGNVIEAETRIYDGDLLSVNDIAIKFNITKVVEIDLTDDGDSTDKITTNNSTSNSLNHGFYFAPTPNYNSEPPEDSMDQDITTFSSNNIQEPRTPNYGYYSESPGESMDLDHGYYFNAESSEDSMELKGTTSFSDY